MLHSLRNSDKRLQQQIIEIAFKLQSEGIISVSPLEWDGSLGPSEEKVINRLGFLLNAYTVQSWYWELVEMLRKLILTTFLAALYHGEPPQLAGSLLAVFIFLMLQILLKPYLNPGLNVFQGLASLSQFFTIFGGLMFVIMGYMDRDLGTDQNQSGKIIVGFLILFANTAAVGLYPIYRVITGILEKGEVDTDSFTSCINFLLGEELTRSISKCCACLPASGTAIGFVKPLVTGALQVHEVSEGASALRESCDLRTAVLASEHADESSENAENATVLHASSLRAPLIPDSDSHLDVEVGALRAASGSQIQLDIRSIHSSLQVEEATVAGVMLTHAELLERDTTSSSRTLWSDKSPQPATAPGSFQGSQSLQPQCPLFLGLAVSTQPAAANADLVYPTYSENRPPRPWRPRDAWPTVYYSPQ